MKDRELTPEEDQYVIRGGNAYATCCSQSGMVGANGVDDRFELVAAHRAGFKSAMSYRDAQDRMRCAAATKMLDHHRWQIAQLAGIMHFKGACCQDDNRPCRACGGVRHVTPVPGGSAEACERCDGQLFSEVGAKDLLATMTKERLIEIVLAMAPIAVAATTRPEWDVREGKFVENDTPIMELFR